MYLVAGLFSLSRCLVLYGHCSHRCGLSPFCIIMPYPCMSKNTYVFLVYIHSSKFMQGMHARQNERNTPAPCDGNKFICSPNCKLFGSVKKTEQILCTSEEQYNNAIYTGKHEYNATFISERYRFVWNKNESPTVLWRKNFLPTDFWSWVELKYLPDRLIHETKWQNQWATAWKMKNTKAKRKSKQQHHHQAGINIRLHADPVERIIWLRTENNKRNSCSTGSTVLKRRSSHGLNCEK